MASFATSGLPRLASKPRPPQPPTLSELDAFLGDDSSKAYEDVVDRLLKSPAYGERMAVMWLDVARYADTIRSVTTSFQMESTCATFMPHCCI